LAQQIERAPKEMGDHIALPDCCDVEVPQPVRITLQIGTNHCYVSAERRIANDRIEPRDLSNAMAAFGLAEHIGVFDAAAGSHARGTPMERHGRLREAGYLSALG
jgi:hypothetical protein